jgi:hypothetical protein
MKISVLFSFTALSLGLVACDRDTPVAAGTDILSEDSTLARSIMAARGDTLTAPVENVIVDEPPPTRVAVTTPAPAPRPAQVQTQTLTPTPVFTPTPRQAPIIAQEKRPAIIATSTKSAEAADERKEIRAARKSEPEPSEASERSGVISSGSSLALVTSERVCDAVREGSTFDAVVADAVRGTNGVVIPSGAHATAEVTSTKSWGAGISVRLKAVRVNGKMYPVSSHTGYVLPESAGCIPARARIDFETKGPLRVVSSIN